MDKVDAKSSSGFLGHQLSSIQASMLVYKGRYSPNHVSGFSRGSLGLSHIVSCTPGLLNPSRVSGESTSLGEEAVCGGKGHEAARGQQLGR